MASKSVKKTNKQVKVVPVFRLKPMGDNRCISKYIGNIDETEQLIDQPIEMCGDNLDKKKILGDCAYYVGEFGAYELTARSCVCNISGSYLIKNNKLPIYYVTFLYEKKFVSGQLFTLFVYFTIDNETENTLLTPKNYVNRSMSGKFTLELVSDESFLSFLINRRTPEIEDELMKKYADEFNENNTDDDNNKIMEKIKTELNDKLYAYRKFFEVTTINYPKKSLVINKMKEIIDNELFGDMVRTGLLQREIDRKEKSCPDQDYKIPKRIINLKEIREHPEKLDEYMDNLSDDSDLSE